MKELSVFKADPYRDDLGKDREARVLVEDQTSYIVEMYHQGVLKEKRLINNHNLQYAEDCAENWVLGVIK